MEDITSQVNMYRECVRNLWNIYFVQALEANKNQQWNIKDEFDEICSKLFSSIALSFAQYDLPEKSHSYERYPEPLLFLHVIPQSEVHIHINREIKATGYWDHPGEMIKPKDIDLRFIDFFDFDVIGFRDFEYLRVRIVGSDTQDLVGRDALIRANYSKIYFKETEVK